MFQKILIANRGEIACRVIETAHKLGIRCVAVYSEADANARHVKLADEAFLLGPAASKDSYLRADKILDIAQKSGAEAIHPGYGFLSENEDFAKACEQVGIVFIGPPVTAIAAMGSKSAAKKIMQDAGVPLVPGYHGDEQTEQRLQTESARIGYPQLLKAAYGGGGKGMRVVWQANEFAEALASARREATASFGNDKMLIERYLTQPRHIEIQVFADNHGNAVYLAERDCSIQRRHQKVIEEAPAPNFSHLQRKAMGEAAVKAAKAIDYRGAGTVEFLFDEDGAFYFMEMNTRLQVEHPVTEMITGQDLVHWQLLVAAGQPLPLTQDAIPLHGHAIEVRVYAEDPEHDFLPQTGTLSYLQQPIASKHVRIDTGVVGGDEVSPFYDPMIAKLIVWDENRDLAIARLRNALADYRIAGVTTNLHFLTCLAAHPAFKAAQLDTHFIARHHAELFAPQHKDEQQALLFATLFILQQRQISADTSNTPWQLYHGWQLNDAATTLLTLHHGETQSLVTVQQHAEDYLIQVAGQAFPCKATLLGNTLTATIADYRTTVQVSWHHNVVSVFIAHQRYDFTYQTDVIIENDQEHSGNLTAPMNGTVVAMLATAGLKVKAGDTLVIMEAMKMEYSIKAPKNGVVNAVFYAAGDLVKDGAELVDFTPEEA